MNYSTSHNKSGRHPNAKLTLVDLDPEFTHEQTTRLERILAASGFLDYRYPSPGHTFPGFAYIVSLDTLDHSEGAPTEREQLDAIAARIYNYVMTPTQHRGPVARHGDVARHGVRGHYRVLRSAYWGDRQGELVKVKPHKRGKINKLRRTPTVY